MNNLNIIGEANGEAKLLIKLQFSREIDIAETISAAKRATEKLGYKLTIEDIRGDYG